MIRLAADKPTRASDVLVIVSECWRALLKWYWGSVNRRGVGGASMLSSGMAGWSRCATKVFRNAIVGFFLYSARDGRSMPP